MDLQLGMAFYWKEDSKVHHWPLNQTRSQTHNQTRASETDNHNINACCEQVQFIQDANSVEALQAVRSAVMQQREFCVQPTGIELNPCAERSLRGTSPGTGTSACFQCMSSGSNGNPKTIRRSHDSWLRSFSVNAKLAAIDSADHYAIVGKLSHSLALYAALEAANLGADIHALGELRPDHQLNAMRTLGSSVLYATPTQLRQLCHRVKNESQIISNLRCIFSGGGKLDKRTASMVKRCFPNACLREFYGASETSFITMTDEHTPEGSVGRAYPGVQLHINTALNDSIDNDIADKKASDKEAVDKQEPCDQQRTHLAGEIWVKSPYLFLDYADANTTLANELAENPISTISSPNTNARWHNGYVSVGEFGYLDNNGYLFLEGRLSRRINVADQLVYPEEIETILNEHPAIFAAAVIPVVDKKRGHILVAIVEVEAEIDNSHTPNWRQELLVTLRQQLGSLKAPRDIIQVDHLPLLASGKPDLSAAEQFVQRH